MSSCYLHSGGLCRYINAISIPKIPFKILLKNFDLHFNIVYLKNPLLMYHTLRLYCTVSSDLEKNGKSTVHSLSDPFSCSNSIDSLTLSALTCFYNGNMHNIFVFFKLSTMAILMKMNLEGSIWTCL